MSTRSMVGGKTDAGTYLVYTHFDGYPEGRLPVLDELVQRDGADKALVTILGADVGGWSYLDPDVESGGRNSLGDRGEIVPGYGLKYTDAPGVTPVKWEDFEPDVFVEFIYLIDTERNVIKWAPMYNVQNKDAVAWRELPVGADAATLERHLRENEDM